MFALQKKQQSVSNAAYNFLVTSYSATIITNWATQQNWLDCFFGFVSLAIQRLPYFYSHIFPVPRFLVPRFLLPRYQRPLNTRHCIYMSLQKSSNEQLIKTEIERKACIFTVNLSAPAAQRRSQVKWLTPVQPEKNVCPASALFQCSLIRSDAVDAAAAGHKTTQRRRRPPFRRRTALYDRPTFTFVKPCICYVYTVSRQ